MARPNDAEPDVQNATQQGTGPTDSAPPEAAPHDGTPQAVQTEPPEDTQPPFLTYEEYQKAAEPLGSKPGTYRTALVLTASIVPLPIAMSIITAILYSTHPDWSIIPVIPTKVVVIFVGLLITLLLWLPVSWPFKAFTAFDTANAQSSSHLRRHVLAVQSGLKVLGEQVDSPGKTDGEGKTLRSFKDATTQDYNLALDSVYKCLVATDERVKNGNLPWIMGEGYIGTWNFVHRAEEAMLAVAPREYVIREALHDEAAIDGSAIANRDYVLSNIKIAVKTLSPSAAVYLKSLSMQDRTTTPGSNTATNNSLGQDKELDPVTELEARNALRDARQTLNEFRASLWEGLVAIRNQLVGTALITALLTYVLLCVAISTDINADSLKAAIIFYLVGAIVGLFSRLYTESQSDSAVDDYGLTMARVVVTPLLSGLAAIAGVLVIAVLSIDVLNAPGTAPGTGLPQLGNVYDIVQNRQGIIAAALFGLSPNLIINILQQKANDATAKLKNSSAPNQGNS